MDNGISSQQDSEQSPQGPPSYSALFPSSRPELQTPDPLAAAAWHNKICSPIHRLPDRILIHIIDMLDNTGIECIRRVARKFPPLCNEPILRRPRTHLQQGVDNQPFVWPRFQSMCHRGQAAELLRIVEGYDDGLPRDRPQLLRLLDKDWYCNGCRAAQEAPDWGKRVAQLRRPLHCSACLTDHPACLFSWSQRLVKAHRRLCIVHEGYLRICSHEKGVIRWQDLLKIERQIGGSKPTKTSCLQCKDASHVTLCKETAIGDDPRLDPGCGERVCGEFVYPTVRVLNMIDDASRKVERLWLNWDAHLPLGQTDWPLTAAALRPRLAELRDNTGRFICPPLASGMDLAELRYFDPNNCDCVGFRGLQNVSSFGGRHTDSTKTIFPARTSLNLTRIQDQGGTRSADMKQDAMECGVLIELAHTGLGTRTFEYDHAIVEAGALWLIIHGASGLDMKGK